MNFDPKIWIAIAAVTAAIISAIISVVNMVVSKDQKTTEFRQEWINALRLEISNLIALAKSLKSQSNIIGYLDSMPDRKKEAIEHMSDAVKIHTKEINASHTKILLYLNPKEHVKLISQIDALVSASRVSSKSEYTDIAKQCQLLIEQSQKVLKKEWTIVKRGEVAFFLTKYTFIIFLACLFVVVLLKLNGIVDVSFGAVGP